MILLNTLQLFFNYSRRTELLTSYVRSPSVSHSSEDKTVKRNRNGQTEELIVLNKIVSLDIYDLTNFYLLFFRSSAYKLAHSRVQIRQGVEIQYFV